MGKYIDEYLANMVRNRLERESNIIHEESNKSSKIEYKISEPINFKLYMKLIKEYKYENHMSNYFDDKNKFVEELQSNIKELNDLESDEILFIFNKIVERGW